MTAARAIPRRATLLLLRLGILIALALAGIPAGRAHEIPADVKLTAFVKPAGGRLELLVRMPMAALTEVELPLRGPGYLDMARIEQALASAVKVHLTDTITLYEGGAPLAPPRVLGARVSLPSDRTFEAFDSARAHVLEGPRLADALDLVWTQQFLDVALEYQVGSQTADLALRWRADRLGRSVTTALRFIPPGGAERALELHGDAGLVRLDPRWHHAARRFVVSGIGHILSGADHLLFLLCLVLPCRRLVPLLIIVTAFTVAHSIALVAAAVGFVPDGQWFPPLIETLIAATIVLMALECIVGAAMGPGMELTRRWMAAFAFGIVHGFGFAFGLTETLQFAGAHLVTALLAFNIGVEIGQVAVLLVLVPLLGLLFRRVKAEPLGIVIIATLVAHTGWHWLLDRGAELARFPWPRIDAAFLAGLLRGLIAVLVLAGAVMAADALLKRWLAAEEPSGRLPRED